MTSSAELRYPPLVYNTLPTFAGEPRDFEAAAPYDLDTLRDHILAIQGGGVRLQRSPEVNTLYMERRAFLAQNTRVSDLADIREEMQGHHIALTHNLFPYHLRHPLHHCVLWMTDTAQLPEAEQFLHATMANWGVRTDRVLWWQNNPNTQSKPGIPHFHTMFELSTPPPLPQFGTIYQRRAIE